MQTVTINFTVSGQTLNVTSLPIKIASNTVKYVKAVFALDSDWTGFDVVSAIWYNDFAQIAVVLDENGECMIPHEVLAKPDDVMVNLVGRDIVNDELVDRLTTYPAKALDVDANAKITGTETAPVTPSQFEQYIAIVEQLVGSVKDIDHTELNADYTLTIYYTDGTSDTVGPIRGAQGETGNGILSAVLNPDYTLTLNYTNGQHDTVGPIRGAQGETGNGIQSIYLTGTSGAVKTYTILFTDGNTTEFQVTDGEVTNAVLESLMPTDTANGSIASFPDGQSVFPLKSLVAEINPIQDLHGYDSPWVAGGGKNKFNPNTLNFDTCYAIASDDTITVSASDGRAWATVPISMHLQAGTYTFSRTNGMGYCAVRTSLDSYATDIAILPNTTTSQSFTLSAEADIKIKVGYAGTNYYPFTVKCQLEQGSTATTWTPYSNICPISGRNSVGVVVDGTNLWDEQWEEGGFDQANGNKKAYNTRIRSKNKIPCAPSTTYYIASGKTYTSWASVYFYDINGNYINYTDLPSVNRTFSTPQNCHYINFNTSGTYGATYNNDLSINYPSTDTSYHAYNPNSTTHTTSLGQTVYGGTLDVVSGVLTVDKVIVGISTLGAVYNSTWKCWVLSGGISGAKVVSANTTATNAIASNMKAVQASGYTTSHDSATFAQNTSGYWFFDNGSTTTLDGTLCYELATPTTIQLTPTQVQTLLGTNNIFADSGDVSVEYVADIQGYIDKKL